MTHAPLEIDSVTAGYENRPVLRDVSFRVRGGEVFALLGPNGAGKSTLLKTVSGLLPALSGRILLNGTPLERTRPREMAQMLAIVTTERMKAERMTCRDVVAMGRYPYTGRLGILSERDRKAVDEAMSLVHVTELCDRPFERISDGQRQRVMLARAICQEPDILVMDEPASYLDVSHKIAFFTLLSRLVRERGIAVVLSLHEIELASHVCDTVLCLKDGKTDKTGKPEILTDAYIEALFGMEQGSYTAFFRKEKKEPEKHGERNGVIPSGREKDREQDRNGISPRYTRGEDGNTYIRSGSRSLRCGYTTGTCAALAAAGAAKALLTGTFPDEMRLVTPSGLPVSVPLTERVTGDGFAACAVQKDSGDDPDVTNGCLVTATVTKSKRGITIDGGEGVGRVTKEGLDRAVGEAAINTVPRRMILSAAEAVCEETGYDGGLSIVISVPGGEETAAKTFNPLLGVTGGISILGTSGIVEPMSGQALIDTIELEIRQALAQKSKTDDRHTDPQKRAGADQADEAGHKKRLILTPGNYGSGFLKENGYDRFDVPAVRCSNFIGDALDIAALYGAEEVLLVGHIGKIVKLAGGIMQTHSKSADCRTELFTAHAALCGADKDVCGLLMEAATTDACLEILEKAGLRDAVMKRILDAIDTHLKRRVSGNYPAGVVVFSNQYGMLGMSSDAKRILAGWKE